MLYLKPSAKGYTTPSQYNKKQFPILEGKDVLASAQTGTGKTAGFTLPILQILSQGQQLRQRPIRALILTPRELAAQILANIKEYSFFRPKSTVIFWWRKPESTSNTTASGNRYFSGHSGRLIDLQNQGLISLAK
jgi:ATP-dependent RNA helicase RhlE